MLICPNLLRSLTDQIILTAHEDLQFAEVCGVSGRIVELQNEISVRRHVALALQVNRRARWNGARILATQVVVPQDRSCDSGRDVSHADNEVVGTLFCTTRNRFSNSGIEYNSRILVELYST